MIISISFQSTIQEATNNKRRENRSANETATIVMIRILLNCLVIALLGGSLYLVYYTTDQLLQVGLKHVNYIQKCQFHSKSVSSLWLNCKRTGVTQ